MFRKYYQTNKKKSRKHKVKRSRKDKVKRSMKDKVKKSRKDKVKRSMKDKVKKSRKLKGGSNCSLVEKPWDINTGKGNYYEYNNNGIGAGGLSPYYGNSIQLQKGGHNIDTSITSPIGLVDSVPQPILDIYRNSINTFSNISNKIEGKQLNSSPLPFKQNKLQS